MLRRFEGRLPVRTSTSSSLPCKRLSDQSLWSRYVQLRIAGLLAVWARDEIGLSWGLEAGIDEPDMAASSSIEHRTGIEKRKGTLTPQIASRKRSRLRVPEQVPIRRVVFAPNFPSSPVPASQGPRVNWRPGRAGQGRVEGQGSSA